MSKTELFIASGKWKVPEILKTNHAASSKRSLETAKLSSNNGLELKWQKRPSWKLSST